VWAAESKNIPPNQTVAWAYPAAPMLRSAECDAVHSQALRAPGGCGRNVTRSGEAEHIHERTRLVTRRMFDGIIPGEVPAGADLYAGYDELEICVAVATDDLAGPREKIGGSLSARLMHNPEFQILESVVSSDAIDVMDVLALQEGPAKVFFHDNLVSRYEPAVDLLRRVPMAVQGPGPHGASLLWFGKRHTAPSLRVVRMAERLCIGRSRAIVYRAARVIHGENRLARRWITVPAPSLVMCRAPSASAHGKTTAVYRAHRSHTSDSKPWIGELA
jgi:hypothetical protein